MRRNMATEGGKVLLQDCSSPHVGEHQEHQGQAVDVPAQGKEQDRPGPIRAARPTL